MKSTSRSSCGELAELRSLHRGAALKVVAQPPEPIPYCHLCDCLIGWLHNATDHWAGPYQWHAPFLETDCASCWDALARLTGD